MRMTSFTAAVPSPRTRRAHRALGPMLLLLVGACGLLDTESPNTVEPGELDSPAGAEARRVGAIADFTFAKDGDGDLNLGRTDGQILLSGLMTDEFVLSTTPPTEQEVDQRRVFENNSTLFDMYWYLHRARAAAENAAVALRQFSLDPDDDERDRRGVEPGRILLRLLRGGLLLRGAVQPPDGDTIAFGEPQTTTEIFNSAVERSTRRWPSRGSSTEEDQGTGNHLPRGRRKGARPPQSRKFHRGGRRGGGGPDGLRLLQRARRRAAPDPERDLQLLHRLSLVAVGSGRRGGLPFRTAEDPRVPFEDPEDVGLDGSTDQFILLKYDQPSTNVPVADGIEARLIEAEAALQAQDLGGMNTILNDLRTLQGLDPLAAPGSFDEGVDQLFSERAFWLFATGHRLGDLRRLIRQYQPGPGGRLPQRRLSQGWLLRHRREPAAAVGSEQQPEFAPGVWIGTRRRKAVRR